MFIQSKSLKHIKLIYYLFIDLFSVCFRITRKYRKVMSNDDFTGKDALRIYTCCIYTVASLCNFIKIVKKATVCLLGPKTRYVSNRLRFYWIYSSIPFQLLKTRATITITTTHTIIRPQNSCVRIKIPRSHWPTSMTIMSCVI